MIIRVKVYVDGKLKKVFNDDLAEDQVLELTNTIKHHVTGLMLMEKRGNLWSADIRWEIEVIR